MKKRNAGAIGSDDLGCFLSAVALDGDGGQVYSNPRRSEPRDKYLRLVDYLVSSHLP